MKGQATYCAQRRCACENVDEVAPSLRAVLWFDGFGGRRALGLRVAPHPGGGEVIQGMTPDWSVAELCLWAGDEVLRGALASAEPDSDAGPAGARRVAEEMLADVRGRFLQDAGRRPLPRDPVLLVAMGASAYGPRLTRISAIRRRLLAMISGKVSAEERQTLLRAERHFFS